MILRFIAVSSSVVLFKINNSPCNDGKYMVQFSKKNFNTKVAKHYRWYFILTVATGRQINLGVDKGFTEKRDKNSRVQLYN